jgi:excisionase family DNA binding protein
VWERDWLSDREPAEVLERFIRQCEEAEAADDKVAPRAVSTTDATLARIESKVDQVLALGQEACQEWLSIARAAFVTDLSYSFIRQAVIAGELPASKAGSVYRIARKDLVEWMEKLKGGCRRIPPKSELDELVRRHLPNRRGRKDSATR